MEALLQIAEPQENLRSVIFVCAFLLLLIAAAIWWLNR